MKLLQPTSMLILLMLPATAALAQPSWKASPPLAPAVKAAKTRLLLKITVSWCATTSVACRELEAELSPSEVVRQLAGYHLLAYDAEQGEGRDVARRYNVIAFPTLLVIDRSGKEVDRLTGHLPRRQLVQWLQQASSGKGSLARLTDRLAAHPTDMALRLRVGAAWAMRGHKVRATKQLNRVIKAAGRQDMPAPVVVGPQRMAARALLVRGHYLELRSLKDYRAAVGTLRTLRLRYPTSPEAHQAIYPMARALHGLGRTKGALRLLSWWARSVEQHRLVAWFCCRNRVAPQQGLLHAQKAVKMQPSRAALWGTLACVQALAGNSAAAGRSWGRALRLEPQTRWYRQQHLLHHSGKMKPSK